MANRVININDSSNLSLQSGFSSARENESTNESVILQRWDTTDPGLGKLKLYFEIMADHPKLADRLLKEDTVSLMHTAGILSHIDDNKSSPCGRYKEWSEGTTNALDESVLIGSIETLIRDDKRCHLLKEIIRLDFTWFSETDSTFADLLVLLGYLSNTSEIIFHPTHLNKLQVTRSGKTVFNQAITNISRYQITVYTEGGDANMEIGSPKTNYGGIFTNNTGNKGDVFNNQKQSETDKKNYWDIIHKNRKVLLWMIVSLVIIFLFLIIAGYLSLSCSTANGCVLFTT